VGTGLTAAGLEHLHAVAEAHVGDGPVPGLVALVARGEQVHVETLGALAVGGPPVRRDPTCHLVVTVLTQRMFETSEAPKVHRDIRAAAYAAIGSRQI
jgi:hypothetical protein